MKITLALLIAASSAVAAPAPAEKSKPSRTSGKVLQAMVKASPSADGPVMSEGRLTMLDKAGHTEEFKVLPRTRVTLDGKPAKFQKAAAPGVLVLRALYDTQTKVLSALDLKSAPLPKPDADDAAVKADSVRGEIANTDVLKGTISVRVGRQSIRDFVVSDSAKIRREAGEKPGEAITLEALKIGDAVEVYSTDGKTAVEIHARSEK